MENEDIENLAEWIKRQVVKKLKEGSDKMELGEYFRLEMNLTCDKGKSDLKCKLIGPVAQ